MAEEAKEEKAEEKPAPAPAKGAKKGKEAKGKRPKKKKQKKIKGNYYSLEGDALKRGKKYCPKCGSGVFMGEHKDRFSCGRCSYTEWKQGGS